MLPEPPIVADQEKAYAVLTALYNKSEENVRDLSEILKLSSAEWNISRDVDHIEHMHSRISKPGPQRLEVTLKFTGALGENDSEHEVVKNFLTKLMNFAQTQG